MARTCAAAGPSEEMDSSSAGAMERVIFVMGGMSVVGVVVVKSISMTTSLPPKVSRLVLFDKSVPVSSA